MATLLRLPEGCDDVALIRESLAFGLAPAPLSAWFSSKDGNGKVSRQEFLSFNEVIFNRMDIKQEGEVDPGNWLSKQTHY